MIYPMQDCTKVRKVPSPLEDYGFRDNLGLGTTW
jgi:hypothetical protein